MKVFFSFVLIIFFVFACKQDKNPLNEVIEKDSFLHSIASDPSNEIQIIYSIIDRDSLQRPTFTTFHYGVDSLRYFYPASTVKLPAVVLAMELINHLGIRELTKFSHVKIDSAHSRQISVFADSSAENNLPTLAHYMKKILVASDNDGFNRLYEFLGQDYINETLHAKKYPNTRIVHRLELQRTIEENQFSNPMHFYKGDSIIYELPLRKSHGGYFPTSKIFKGKGYIDSTNNLVNSPFEFTYKNSFPLFEQHRFIQALFFPDNFPSYGFDLTGEDYAFLYKNMGSYLSESEMPIYSDTAYFDAYVKFFIYGSSPTARIDPSVRIFNKIGLAYGFAIDNAYIVDVEAGVEFFLSAVVLANPDQIFNDGVYAYDSIAFPFLARLGTKILESERMRKKNYKPDFQYLNSLF